MDNWLNFFRIIPLLRWLWLRWRLWKYRSIDVLFGHRRWSKLWPFVEASHINTSRCNCSLDVAPGSICLRQSLLIHSWKVFQLWSRFIYVLKCLVYILNVNLTNDFVKRLVKIRRVCVKRNVSRLWIRLIRSSFSINYKTIIFQPDILSLQHVLLALHIFILAKLSL